MNIAKLRKDHPDWQWAATRHGFGTMEYVGRKGEREVRVYSAAVHCGPADDDYSTRWYVDDARVASDYSIWSLQESPLALVGQWMRGAMRAKVGERVGCILSSDEQRKRVRFLGYGVRLQDRIPHEAAGFLAQAVFAVGLTSACLQLDDGSIVYGCECWWSTEERMRQLVAAWEREGYVVEQVSIASAREEARS